MTTTWDRLAAGEGCAFDAPRAPHTAHWDAVATLTASTLYLPQDQTYRGHCILVFDPRHETRLDALSTQEWTAFSADVRRSIRALSAVCAPDHLNVASLGNLMPHLHWHLVPRYKTDPHWGAPIWSYDSPVDPGRRLEPEDRAALLAALRGALERE
jgi:diadenosine tetraphosphate (Ap4A) HIT family hydrolase